MNLNETLIPIKNQTKKEIFLWVSVFLFTIVCFIRVVYVNAAENKDTEEPVQEVISWTTTSNQLQEKLRIRMANEDAIPVAHLIHDNSFVESQSGCLLSEKDYNILTRIVEAEATGLDKKSKILVANVILNRMNHDEFPDTVEEVVFQNVNGATQFSPVSDGRYYTVDITDSTKEAVNRALAGEDYSDGALYFMERSMSSKSSVEWFDNCLTRLFKYQGHEFYR